MQMPMMKKCKEEHITHHHLVCLPASACLLLLLLLMPIKTTPWPVTLLAIPSAPTPLHPQPLFMFTSQRLEAIWTTSCPHYGLFPPVARVATDTYVL